MTFIEAVIEGSAKLEDIDDWVDEWHASSSEASLGGFLGLDHAQYARWIENPKSLNDLVISLCEKRKMSL